MYLLIANALCPVFFVLALGYFAGSRKLLKSPDALPLMLILMNFALPASLFTAMEQTSRSVIFAHIPVMFCLSIAMLVIYALAWMIEHRLNGGSSSEAAVQALTVAFPNCVAVGIPLLGSLFGQEGLILISAAIAAGAILVSPLTLSILRDSTSRTQKESIAERLLRAIFAAFRRPVVLAPLLGLGLALTGHHLPDLAISMLMLIGRVTGAVALFLTGLIISSHPFRLSKNVIVGVMLKNLLQVAVMLLLIRAFSLSGSIASAALVFAALPAGFFGTLFSMAHGRNPTVASTTLAASSISSIITLPLAIYLSQVLFR